MIGHPPKHLDTINHDRQVNCTLCRVTQFHGREAEGCERRNHPRFCIVWYFWTNTLKFWTVNTWLMNSSNMTWTARNIFLLILPLYNIHCTWTVRACPTYCAWTSTALSIQSTAILTLQWTFLHTKKKKQNSYVKSQRGAFIMSSSLFFWNSNLCKNINFSLLTCIHVSFVLFLHCTFKYY